MVDAPLPTLPLPVIEREPLLQELFDARITQMRGLLPDWDTWMLRSDPINLMCRHAAYGDLLYITSLNDTFRATLIDFAQGADLLSQGTDWNLSPQEGEDLETFRRRLRERKKGQGGFTESWYVRYAFEADAARVADVGVEGDSKGGVTVYILSKDNGGVADQSLLDVVQDALDSPLVLGCNDTITVKRAVIRVVDVKAEVWLLPEAPADEMAKAEQRLRDEFAAARRLGWDFTADFAIAALRTTGVRRIVMEEPDPSSFVSVGPNEAVALGTIELEYMGRSY